MRITDTHIYFYTEFYSNWHPCKFIDPINRIEFSNSEQCFMYYKAKFFHDDEIADLIAETPNPKDNKNLGRRIQNYNEDAWRCVRLGFMVYANFLKFSQNQEFKIGLLNTGEKILVEASKVDKIWGVGLSQNDDLILDEKNWLGLNCLGSALMLVRKKLKE